MAKNGKYDSFNYQYSLLLLDAQERGRGGLTSCRDLEGTKRLARGILHLDSRIAFVDIYTYAPRAADLEHCEPLVRSSLDDPEEGE